jgi:hypothetical protein
MRPSGDNLVPWLLGDFVHSKLGVSFSHYYWGFRRRCLDIFVRVSYTDNGATLLMYDSCLVILCAHALACSVSADVDISAMFEFFNHSDLQLVNYTYFNRFTRWI